MGACVPAVEVADDRHAVGVGRPYREVDALDAAILDQVGAQLLVETKVRALVEEMKVLVG
jgi:hypothetical protein